MLRDPDLPDALYDLEGDVAPSYRRSQQDRLQRLEVLGNVIGTKRDDAVKARLESGIEKIWTAAEEAYMGIDEVNRSEFSGSRWAKPTSSAGPLTRDKPQASKKSTVFVPLTARYVDMAYAKVSEIILPVDDKPFAISETPIPDLVAGLMDTRQAAGADGQPMTGPDGQPVTNAKLLQQAVDKARASAKKEENWIYDNFVESNYPREMRKVLFDAARIGTGVLKGPMPVERKSQAFSVTDGVGKLEIQKRIKPGVSWMSVWDLFPAKGCGEDVHEGDHILERDFFSPGKLKALKNLRDQTGVPIFLGSQIDKVIAEGPSKCNAPPDGSRPEKTDTTTQFEVWHFYGTLTAQDMKDMGAAGSEDMPDALAEVFAIVTLVNDTVIRATINPLESGKFPYRVMCWQRRSGFWAGIGVGERVTVPQNMINGATRAMLNNAGKSSGSHIVLDRRAIAPADGDWDLNTGDKLWELTGQGLVEDVRQIFLTYTIPNITPQMLTIIQNAQQMAEQATNLPLVSQGQSGENDPETFGQSELQDSNAKVLLRAIAWNVDDSVTEPVVKDFHEWYLLDPEVPEEDKGDFEINARGSIAMVERAIQEQTYTALLPLSRDPVWGQDPKKLFAQFLRTKRLNPDDTAYTPADLAKLQSTPPPEAPQVQVAKINAATKLHIADMSGGASAGAAGAGAGGEHAAAAVRREEIRAESAERVEASRSNAEAARAEKDLLIAQTAQETALETLRIKRELALLEYANREKVTLMQIQAQLANTAIQARNKHELQGAEHDLRASEGHQDRVVDLHKHHTAIEADAASARTAADQVQATTGASPAAVQEAVA